VKSQEVKNGMACQREGKKDLECENVAKRCKIHESPGQVVRKGISLFSWVERVTRTGTMEGDDILLM
jgi:hypothetical protein